MKSYNDCLEALSSVDAVSVESLRLGINLTVAFTTERIRKDAKAPRAKPVKIPPSLFKPLWSNFFCSLSISFASLGFSFSFFA